MIIEINPSVNVNVTVQFEDPKWVAMVERSDAQRVATARVEFDSEPSEAELRDYIVKNYESLQFSAPVDARTPTQKGQDALKRLLEQKQHQTAIAARLNQQGGRLKQSQMQSKHKDKRRGIR